MYLEGERNDNTRSNKAVLGFIVFGAVLGISGWIIGQFFIGLEAERGRLAWENERLNLANKQLEWTVEGLKATSRIPEYEKAIEELKTQLTDKEMFYSQLVQAYRDQVRQLQDEYSQRLRALRQQLDSPSTK
ncbi:hypothetical protein HYR54_14895 [Candidatus Acetothermia bacterium]|nr:hypothetical protein [Candidatus Acetothermia bacterium]